MYLSSSEKDKEYKNCTGNASRSWTFNITEVEVLVCHNGSEIKNRGWWAQDLVFININASRIDPGHVKRLPSTCENVGMNAQKTVLITQVTFPPNNRQCISRRKRAWYDTLLGGYGALTGTVNGFDIETLANRLHSAGSKINEGLTLQANWMPTIFGPAKIAAGVDTLMNQLINASANFQQGFDTNVTRFVNWTICTLQTMYEQQQKSTMQTMLMTGNEQVWRTMFNSSVARDAWIHLEATKMVCNDKFILYADQETHVNVYWNPLNLSIPTWDFKLDKLHQIMRESSEIAQHIRVLNSSIIAHQVTTTIIAGKIKKIGSAIQDATAHHWWDLFTGYSPSASKIMNFLIHPVLVLCIVVILLSIWNCVVFYRMCCKTQKVLMVAYIREN